MYKLCFFVPEADVDLVKAAVFKAGAGRIGDYDHCCWQVLGQGQFRPLPGSQPHIGRQGAIETVAEYKVEMVCDDSLVAAAVDALKQAHPYEEPAFEVWKLEEL
ncbi:MAG: YqfO family protein [Pseudomonadota bacterium]|nr:YqfO family protein [Pseudomonadota bacterium]